MVCTHLVEAHLPLLKHFDITQQKGMFGVKCRGNEWEEIEDAALCFLNKQKYSCSVLSGTISDKGHNLTNLTNSNTSVRLSRYQIFTPRLVCVSTWSKEFRITVLLEFL